MAAQVDLGERGPVRRPPASGSRLKERSARAGLPPPENRTGTTAFAGLTFSGPAAFVRCSVVSIGAHVPAAFFARWGRASIWVSILPLGCAQMSWVSVVAVSTSTFLPVRFASATAVASSRGPTDAFRASVEVWEPGTVGPFGCHQGSSAAVSAARTRPRVRVSRVRVRTNGLRRLGGAGTAFDSRVNQRISDRTDSPAVQTAGRRRAHDHTATKRRPYLRDL